MRKPTFKPVCPNHGEPLEGYGFPMPEHGRGICPVSGAPFMFDAEVDKEKVVKQKDGTIEKAIGWKITGDDSPKPKGRKSGDQAGWGK